MFNKYNAKAIRIKDYLKNDYVRFEKSFFLEKKENATLFISADSRYSCYINDKFVYCGQISGIKNERFYDEIDISDYIKNGENILHILTYYEGKDTLINISREPYLKFMIKSESDVIISDSSVKCARDIRFKCGEIYNITPQLGYGFYFDAGNEIIWENAEEIEENYNFSPAPMLKCNISEIKNGIIITQGKYFEKEKYDTVAKDMQNAFLCTKEPHEVFEEKEYGEITLSEPLKIKNSSEGTFILFDLKKETAGYFSMDITAKKGTVIKISYGEHLSDLRVRSFTGGRNFAFSYICKDGRQSFDYFIKRIAGRYIQLHIENPDDFIIHSFGIKKCEYPFIEKASYKGDKLLEKIYSVSVDTLKLCMHEHYEDCPWREQGMYMMDSRIQMLLGYYAFENTEPQKQALITFMKSADENGKLPLTAPSESFYHTIPAFMIMWVVAYNDYLKYTDDTSDIKEMSEFAGKVIKLFSDMYDEKGIKIPEDEDYWNFYDWEKGLSNPPWNNEIWNREKIFNRGYDAPIMFYYIMALECYAQILEKAGQDNSFVNDIIKKAKKDVNTLFWDEERRMYRTYSNIPYHFCELVQSLAICTKSAENEAELKEKLKNSECGVKATLSMMLFKYLALWEAEVDKKWVISDIVNTWGNMLYSGATSFWETQKGGYDFENGGSQCHGWSAVPVYFLKKL